MGNRSGLCEGQGSTKVASAWMRALVGLPTVCQWQLQSVGRLHPAAFRQGLRPERADLALWVRPVHASSMVESTADDHLTLDGDANVCREQRRCDAARTLPSAADHWVIEDRTQWMV